MYKFLVCFIILNLLSSCSKNNFDTSLSEYRFPQKWQLVKMTGNYSGSETLGANMEWQEYYLLEEDGTFLKSRTRDGFIIKEKGTYIFIKNKTVKSLITTYDRSNSLIANCSSDKSEYLSILTSDTLIGSWSSCDGPGLFYKRVR